MDAVRSILLLHGADTAENAMLRHPAGL